MPLSNQNSSILPGVEIDRITSIIEAPLVPGKDYILYWMQKAQRVEYNPALELAVQIARATGLEIQVLFILTSYLNAGAPHYQFMLEGLNETAVSLARRGVRFDLISGNPPELIARHAEHSAIIITDAPRLPLEKQWRTELKCLLEGDQKGKPAIPVLEIETEALVPPKLASQKLEWAARTIRPKILSHIDRCVQNRNEIDWVLPFHVESPSPFVPEMLPVQCTRDSGRDIESCFPENRSLSHPEPCHEKNSSCSRSVSDQVGRGTDRIKEQHIGITGGYKAASTQLSRFLESGGIDQYTDWHNDPSRDGSSGLSPYLHFGQISSAEITEKILEHEAARMNTRKLPGAAELIRGESSAGAFLEQLIVRRELAANFCLQLEDCREFSQAVPSWAVLTLEATKTQREDLYTYRELEHAATNDPLWNAAQQQMVLTGSMHGYMRMYWGKQVLRWVRDPRKAFSLLCTMNDTYSLDGRDPNGYAGIAWCFGRHDRPWPSQPAFGTVRSMTGNSLRKKFDMDSYTSTISLLYTERQQRAVPQ